MKREYFDHLSAEWDSLPAPPEAAEGAVRFVQEAWFVRARRVLDVGCGTGVLVPAVLDLLPPGGALVECDFAFGMLKRNAAKYAGGPICRVCGDALHPPFADGAFDLVLCFGVLPHLGAPADAFERLWPLVAAEGRLAVGHLMSSAELNELHAALGEPVRGDRLQPAGELAPVLAHLGAEILRAEEEPGRYFILARKPR